MYKTFTIYIKNTIRISITAEIFIINAVINKIISCETVKMEHLRMLHPAVREYIAIMSNLLN